MIIINSNAKKSHRSRPSRFGYCQSAVRPIINTPASLSSREILPVILSLLLLSSSSSLLILLSQSRVPISIIIVLTRRPPPCNYGWRCADCCCPDVSRTRRLPEFARLRWCALLRVSEREHAYLYIIHYIIYIQHCGCCISAHVI